MTSVPGADEIRSIAPLLDGWKWPDDIQMPTLEELERDLALDDPAWKGLLRSVDNDAGLVRRKCDQYRSGLF